MPVAMRSVVCPGVLVVAARRRVCSALGHRQGGCVLLHTLLNFHRYFSVFIHTPRHKARCSMPFACWNPVPVGAQSAVKRLLAFAKQERARRLFHDRFFTGANVCWTLPTRWITLPPTLKPNDWVKLLLGVSGSRLYMLLAASTVL
jgi:hypothetical protein